MPRKSHKQFPRKRRNDPSTVSLTQQPSTRCVIYGTVTANLQIQNFINSAISSSIWLSPRFVAYAAAFLNVRIKKVHVEPYALSVGQFVEYALLPSHLPALLSGFDATPAIGSLPSSILTLPGARKAQQGNAMPSRCTLKLPKTMEFACSRVATDSPPIAYLALYGTTQLSMNIWCEVVFTGYTTVN